MATILKEWPAYGNWWVRFENATGLHHVQFPSQPSGAVRDETILAFEERQLDAAQESLGGEEEMI